MSSSDQDNRDDWDRHWDRFAQAATANPAQRMRHRLIARLLQAEARAGGNLRVCDFGSGQGDLVCGLSRALLGASFVGLELSTSGVEISRRKLPRARFEVADLFARIPEDFGLREWATHGVCSEVLEHVDDPRALLQAMLGYLAPGGVLVVTVPGGPMSAFDRHIGHRQHFTRASIAASTTCCAPRTLVRTASNGLYSHASTCFIAAAWTTMSAPSTARVIRARSRTSPMR